MNKTAAAESIDLGMSTVMMHRAFGRHAGKALEAVRKEVIQLEGSLSRFMPGSEISRINRSAGSKCEKLSGGTYQVLSRAVELSHCCRGLFDITVGPLTALWNSSKDTCRPPEEARIKQLLPLVDYTDLMLDSCKRTALLRRKGQSIDLGGIGKGFAGDKLLEVYKKYDISSAYSNIGGNVAALGTKPDGSPWRVGIRHPRQENSLIGLVSIEDKAVVTSGDYQRYFIGGDGKRYHHILDPSTGYPAEAKVISVTVVSGSSMDADALSTILFIAGMRKGLDILRGFPGAEAIFVDTELRVHVTAGLAEHFQAAEDIKVNIMNEIEEKII